MLLAKLSSFCCCSAAVDFTQLLSVCAEALNTLSWVCWLACLSPPSPTCSNSLLMFSFPLPLGLGAGAVTPVTDCYLQLPITQVKFLSLCVSLCVSDRRESALSFLTQLLRNCVTVAQLGTSVTDGITSQCASMTVHQ